MKYRKIFTFILLLCTIFSTLFAFTLNVNAITEVGGGVVDKAAPTDLSGYTVIVPANWVASAGYGYFELNYDFIYTTSLGEQVTLKEMSATMYIGYQLASRPFESPTEAINYFCIPSYPLEITPSTTFSIYIYDGDDSTNQSLINWFVSNNATFDNGEEPPLDPTYTISGQYQFNEEITWLYDTSEQEGILYLPFYVYNLDNSTRVNYDYMLNQNREDLDINYFLYANETDIGTFIGQYAGRFTTSTIINMFGDERIIYFYSSEVSEEVYTWLNENGRFINDPTLDPNNPDNPDSENNPNNPNNPDFGTDTVRQIVNQVNAFLGIQILPGLSFRDILLICIALPLLMYILKVFLGG